MLSTTRHSHRAAGDDGQVLPLRRGARRPPHHRRARVRRRHDAARTAGPAERGGRSCPGRCQVRADLGVRRRDGSTPNCDPERVRRRGPERGGQRLHSADPRAIHRHARLHRGSDRGNAPVHLRGDHRQGSLAGGGVCRRHQQTEPDLHVLDARVRPDGVQGDTGLGHWRGHRGRSSIQSNSSGEEGTDPPISFSRTGGSTITVGADVYCRAVGPIQDQGSETMGQCIPAANSFALPDPLRNLAAPAKPALAAGMQQLGPHEGRSRLLPREGRLQSSIRDADTAVRCRRERSRLPQPGLDPPSGSLSARAGRVERRDCIPNAGHLLDRRRRR